jgi:hypothetical protein
VIRPFSEGVRVKLVDITRRIVQNLLGQGETSHPTTATTKALVASLARAFVNTSNDCVSGPRPSNTQCFNIVERLSDTNRDAGAIKMGGIPIRGHGYDMSLLLGGLISRHVLRHVEPACGLDIFVDAFITELRRQDAAFGRVYVSTFQQAGPVVQGIVAAVHIETLNMLASSDVLPKRLAKTYGEPCNVVEAAFVCYLMSGPAKELSPQAIQAHACSQLPPELVCVGLELEDADCPPNIFHTYVLTCFFRLLEASKRDSTHAVRPYCNALNLSFLVTYHKEIIPEMCRFMTSPEVRDTAGEVFRARPEVLQMLVEALYTATPHFVSLHLYSPRSFQYCGYALHLWAELLGDLHFELLRTGQIWHGHDFAIEALRMLVTSLPECAEYMGNVITDLRTTRDGIPRWNPLRAAFMGALSRARAARDLLAPPELSEPEPYRKRLRGRQPSRK